jgi:hypothetical protein
VTERNSDSYPMVNFELGKDFRSGYTNRLLAVGNTYSGNSASSAAGHLLCLRLSKAAY